MFPHLTWRGGGGAGRGGQKAEAVLSKRKAVMAETKLGRNKSWDETRYEN